MLPVGLHERQQADWDMLPHTAGISETHFLDHEVFFQKQECNLCTLASSAHSVTIVAFA